MNCFYDQIACSVGMIFRRIGTSLYHILGLQCLIIWPFNGPSSASEPDPHLLTVHRHCTSLRPRFTYYIHFNKSVLVSHLSSISYSPCCRFPLLHPRSRVSAHISCHYHIVSHNSLITILVRPRLHHLAIDCWSLLIPLPTLFGSF